MEEQYFSKNLDNLSTINFSRNELSSLGFNLEIISKAGYGLEGIARTMDFILVCHGCGVDNLTEEFTNGEVVLGDLVNAVAAIGMLLHHETEHAKKKCDRIIDQEAARLATRKGA